LSIKLLVFYLEIHGPPCFQALFPPTTLMVNYFEEVIYFEWKRGGNASKI